MPARVGVEAINYYEHHIGDYAAATAHLSWDEDMAYTRLLRAYYHHERGIPEGQGYRIARATTPAQRRAVDAVLAEFFVVVDGAYTQKRADAEIARFHDKQNKAKASANARWAQCERSANASDERSANAMRTHSEGNAPSLQTPDTSRNTPPNPRKRGNVHEFPPGFDRFWSAYPRKVARPAAEKAFARLRPDDALLDVMLAALGRHCDGWTDPQFIPHPASWLNARRWEDEAPRAGKDAFAGSV